MNPSPSPLSPITSRTLAATALATLVQACLLLSGCGKTEGGAAASASAASGAAAAAAASAPPVGVTTVRAAQRDMPVLITATGTVAPLSSVEVRAQTTAPLGQVHVTEGQFVKAGQLLFTLDPRAEEANVAKARAQLARDEAALADAQRQLRRSEELLAQNFVSQGALDTNRTAVQSQAAAVAADKAALDAARLTLSYTRITATSAGRLGAINIFPGSLVQANQTLLVTITQLDPITVSFSLPQRHLADALAALKDGGAPVTALPADPSGVAAPTAPAAPREAASGAAGSAAGAASAPAGPRPVATLSGRLKFVDNAVDPATGTVKVKAQFDNREGKLWPGAFINVAMTARVIKDAVVLPQAAIVQSARGPLVYAVREGKAVARPVQVLYAQGDDAAVSGLKPGERIVLEGRQNVRPGANVVERNREGGGGKGGGNKPADGAASASSSNAGNAGSTRTPSP